MLQLRTRSHRWSTTMSLLHGEIYQDREITNSSCAALPLQGLPLGTFVEHCAECVVWTADPGCRSRDICCVSLLLWSVCGDSRCSDTLASATAALPSVSCMRKPNRRVVLVQADTVDIRDIEVADAQTGHIIKQLPLVETTNNIKSAK